MIENTSNPVGSTTNAQTSSDGNQPSLHVELTAEQVEILADVLESYLPDLRYEIADTDSNDFRHMLKHRQAALMEVLEVLRGGAKQPAG